MLDWNRKKIKVKATLKVRYKNKLNKINLFLAKHFLPSNCNSYKFCKAYRTFLKICSVSCTISLNNNLCKMKIFHRDFLLYSLSICFHLNRINLCLTSQLSSCNVLCEYF